MVSIYGICGNFIELLYKEIFDFQNICLIDSKYLIHGSPKLFLPLIGLCDKPKSNILSRKYSCSTYVSSYNMLSKRYFNSKPLIYINLIRDV